MYGEGDRKLKMEVSEETCQKLLKIIDRLGQPIDTEQAGILNIQQFYFKFDAKHSMENVKL